ncbi:hypothetical protein K438DRAFT_2025938 [Mycena galopus ATCC 62051]|nr:hypothetical protein K438DRAFT_2025938 [Mycena galopus ATCC 62051]
MAIRAAHLELENQQRIKDAKTLGFTQGIAGTSPPAPHFIPECQISVERLVQDALTLLSEVPSSCPAPPHPPAHSPLHSHSLLNPPPCAPAPSCSRGLRGSHQRTTRLVWQGQHRRHPCILLLPRAALLCDAHTVRLSTKLRREVPSTCLHWPLPR